MNRRDFIKLLGKVAGALGVAGVMGLPEVEAIDDYELAKELVLKFRRDKQMGVVLPGPKEDIEDVDIWEPIFYPFRVYDPDGNLIAIKYAEYDPEYGFELAWSISDNGGYPK